VLWSFTGEADGDQPISGVIFDNAGNLYGTTSNGNDLTEFGTVYELSPSQSGWTETTLYDFTDGTMGAAPVVSSWIRTVTCLGSRAIFPLAPLTN